MNVWLCVAGRSFLTQLHIIVSRHFYYLFLKMGKMETSIWLNISLSTLYEQKNVELANSTFFQNAFSFTNATCHVPF